MASLPPPNQTGISSRSSVAASIMSSRRSAPERLASPYASFSSAESRSPVPRAAITLPGASAFKVLNWLTK